jgi:FdhD protein
VNAELEPSQPVEDDDPARRPVSVVRFQSGAARPAEDFVAHEEPLEIRLNGVGIAVVMRTPGHDEELALGFLLTERVIRSASEVLALRHCTTVSEPEAEGNVLQIVLADDVAVPLERLRRNTYASSSCGLCGKATIAAALLELAPVKSELRTDFASLCAMPVALRAAQPAFELTGGLHAAALFTANGELVLAREDVGRHNAVDKVLGAAARLGIAASQHVLFVSGRVSLEIVQKAAAIAVPVVAAVSAPTSLAVRYAEALGVTLVGFVRGQRLNVYAHPARLRERIR